MKTAPHQAPPPRSGHSCEIFENYMVVFGGIQEITKELNDFYLYNFNTMTWITLFEESTSPNKITEGYGTLGQDLSPTGGNSPKKSTGSPHGKNSSFRKSSPPKTMNRSMNKSMMKSGSPVKRNLNISTA